MWSCSSRVERVVSLPVETLGEDALSEEKKLAHSQMLAQLGLQGVLLPTVHNMRPKELRYICE